MTTNHRPTAFEAQPYERLPDIAARGKYLGGRNPLHMYGFRFDPNEILRRGLMRGVAEFTLMIDETKVGFRPKDPYSLLSQGLLALIDNSSVPMFIGKVHTNIVRGEFFEASLWYGREVSQEEQKAAENKLLQILRGG